MTLLSSRGSFGRSRSFTFALGHFLARGEFFFFVVGHLLHLGIFRFEKHLVGADEVFFDLFEFAVLGDDFAEFGLLLGDFLEARRVRNDLRRGKFLRELVVASAKLIQFFSKRKNGHCSASRVFSDQFSVFSKRKLG